MDNLENILEINTAIVVQKRYKKDVLSDIVDALFKIGEKFVYPKVEENKKTEKDFALKTGKNFIEEEPKAGYKPFRILGDYISMAKDKLYGYYTQFKDFLKNAIKSSRKDSLLTEFEDWGVVYYKSVFRKLMRLTPMGITQRYLEKLWLYVPKKIG